jgi:hypothetical protein
VTPILVVDNSGRPVWRGHVFGHGPLHARALVPALPRVNEVLAGPTPAAARIQVEHINREVAVRIERRSRRRRWLRAAYGTGRALGALAILAALVLAGVSVVFGGGHLAWWLFL